jgi:hypothetical protein
MLALLILACLAALVFTWPLAGNFFSAIPYSLYPLDGYERVLLMPGDHLQTHYWFWLLSDNLFGASPLFTNPYEFNAGDVRLVSQFVNFPLSLLYVALLPLGPVGAYNGVVVLSFLLAAAGGCLLARRFTDDPWAALLAGAILAMAPARVSQVAAGQMFGLLFGLLPLCLYFVEKACASARWVWGLAAGAVVALMAVMEPHLTYFTALTLGVYLPGRLLLGAGEDQPQAPDPGPRQPAPGPPWRETAWVLAAGAAMALFVVLRLTRQPHLAGAGGRLFAQALILWPLTALVAWLTLSALAARLTALAPAAARRKTAQAFLAWTPLAFYLVQPRLDIPHLGGLLLAVCALAFAAMLARLMLGHRRPRPALAWKGFIAAGAGLGLGLAGGVAYLLHQRAANFLGSIAGAGRALGEITLFSPQPWGLFQMQGGPDERFVLLGWAVLALGLLACLPMLGRAGVHGGGRVLALLLAFLGAALTLGPTLPAFPFYDLLYDHLPFFRYPRVSGRFVIIALVFLGVLASLGLADLRRMLRERGWGKAAACAPALAVLLLAWQYHTGLPVGLSLFPAQAPLLERIAAAPDKGLVLELPLWPGDSHQSSRYEYDVTRTRRAMVNGYSPVVSRQYVEEVFHPLHSLDLGELRPEQARLLHEFKVDLVTLHDDSLVYPLKVSPFPPRLALKRLLASGWLESLGSEGNLSLFRLRREPLPQTTPPESITSPVRALWYAAELRSATGRGGLAPQASGYNLLLEQDSRGGASKTTLKPRVRGNLLQAEPGRDQPGVLAYGPGRALPPGRYLARFRLRADAAGVQGALGRVEVASPGQGEPLAGRDLTPSDFPHPGQWTDLALPFSLATTAMMECRVHFSGQAPLALNLVTVGFQGTADGPGAWQAEDLLRQTGVVVQDAQASGALAVMARAGQDPPIYLQHGPYVTMEPGRYRALFHLRAGQAPPAVHELALLEVATDMGRRLLAQRRLAPTDLPQDSYAPVEMDFTVPFRCELDLRVRYLGGADLYADQVEIRVAGDRRP